MPSEFLKAQLKKAWMGKRNKKGKGVSQREHRPGDWACSAEGCAELNFATRTICRRTCMSHSVTVCAVVFAVYFVSPRRSQRCKPSSLHPLPPACCAGHSCLLTKSCNRVARAGNLCVHRLESTRNVVFIIRYYGTLQPPARLIIPRHCC